METLITRAMTTARTAARPEAVLEAKASLMAGCPVEVTAIGAGRFSMLSDGDQRPGMNDLREWLLAAKSTRLACPDAAEYDEETDCTVLYMHIQSPLKRTA